LVAVMAKGGAVFGGVWSTAHLLHDASAVIASAGVNAASAGDKLQRFLDDVRPLRRRAWACLIRRRLAPMATPTGWQPPAGSQRRVAQSRSRRCALADALLHDRKANRKTGLWLASAILAWLTPASLEAHLRGRRCARSRDRPAIGAAAS
jgi:hypothetical protein